MSLLIHSLDKAVSYVFKSQALSKKYKEKFAKLGLIYPEHFILHLPLRYEDETQLIEIDSLESGKVQQVEAYVVEHKVIFHPRKQLLVWLKGKSSRLLMLRLLNFYFSQLKMFAVGRCLRVLGEVRSGYYGLEMVHPKIRIVTKGIPLEKTLTPIYATTAGLQQSTLRLMIDWFLANSNLDETIPKYFLQKYGHFSRLPNFSSAIKILHHPPADIDKQSLLNKTHPAWQRIKLDELIAQQISLGILRLMREKYIAFAMRKLPSQQSTADKIRIRLPFRLTESQSKVLLEISNDLSKEKPMYRLLQGDVGCGKSIVAALAAAQVLDAGFQVVLMVPTELLAEQHGLKMHSWFSPFDFKIVILTSSKNHREKLLIYSQVANGEANLLIGTQSVIQKNIKFFKLGLVIIDEQHRFGVAQRLALRNKAMTRSLLTNDCDNSESFIGSNGISYIGICNYFEKSSDVHQLMMSATPIPRTLAMSYFSDLDVSTIDELPVGRHQVLTRLVDNDRRNEVIHRIRAAAIEGKQIYWVCPLIEENERLELSTALDIFKNFCIRLPDIKVGLLHGKLPYKQKKEVMANFLDGNIQLLVSTTVIEVGVDVPNASLMVIEHAERFGLAQLHQLRGRIGRGLHESVCLLLYQKPLSYSARKRLEILRNCADGFAIAKKDLELRGPGDFLGVRQSGEVLFRFVNLKEDSNLFEIAKEIAEKMLSESLSLAKKHVKRWSN